MNNGPGSESAIEFGGSHIEPVGAGGASTAGASPNPRVSSNLYELDGRVAVGTSGELAAAIGHATVHDRQDVFDRDLTWFFVQAKWRLAPKLFAAARYSEIGTYDDSEGYHFDGKTIAGGNAAFGYDSSRLQRYSVGFGWQANDATLLKLEVGQDRFDVIDASPFVPGASDRLFFGGQLVVSF